MESANRSRQIVDFEAFDLRVDRFRCRQQCRDGDQRPQVRGNTVPQLERRQRRRTEAGGHGAVDQSDGRVDGRNGAD